MDGVLAKIDTGATIVGRQILYHQLRTCESDEVLASRARDQESFQRDAPLAGRVLKELGKLCGPDAKWLAHLILQPLPARPRYSWSLVPLGVACFLCCVGMPFFHPLLVPAIVLGLVNACIHVKFSEKIYPFFFGFSQISRMMGTGTALSKIPGGDSFPDIVRLRQAQPAISRLKRQLGWLAMDRASIPEPFNSIVEYLNVFFLADLIIFVRSIERLRENRQLLLGYFESIGSLDATVAVAGYWKSSAPISRPQFADSREINVDGLRHPLVADAVGGILSLRDRSAIIAGPNMAGKTTFIRTVAINLILARTLNLCLAKSATLPRATVHSAIRSEDMLSAGQSYFFAELDRIQEFTELSHGSGLRLFLIDEPFRGTNTVERIAISSAVLRYLANRHLVLASTHDAELQMLLADAFDMFHFSDRVVNDSYGFDYLIRPGPAKTKNAIRLLEIRGYPASVISESERTAASLASKAQPHNGDSAAVEGQP